MYKFPSHNLKAVVFLVFLPVLFLFLATTIPANAATIYLDPASMSIGPNQTISIRVKIGMAANECVNTVQVGLSFPNDILEVKDFNSGESFLSLWAPGGRPEKEMMPQINKEGKIVFAGGIPGGYCGQIPGDSGDSNLLGSIIFSPKKPIVFHKAKIDFTSDTLAYLNDGQGTLAPISAQGAVLQIDEKITTSNDEWADVLKSDIIPPEFFVIEIDNNPRIANGQYFVVYSAVDKQTGIDHYEVLESKINYVNRKETVFEKFFRKIFNIKEPLPAIWAKAESPYILKDQSLNSVIKVKALDRVGNERVVEYDNAALKSLRHSQPVQYQFIFTIGVIVIILIFIIAPLIILIKKKLKRKK